MFIMNPDLWFIINESRALAMMPFLNRNEIADSQLILADLINYGP